jgi:hypothetical protein
VGLLVCAGSTTMRARDMTNLLGMRARLLASMLRTSAMNASRSALSVLRTRALNMSVLRRRSVLLALRMGSRRMVNSGTMLRAVRAGLAAMLRARLTAMLRAGLTATLRARRGTTLCVTNKKKRMKKKGKKKKERTNKKKPKKSDKWQAQTRQDKAASRKQQRRHAKKGGRKKKGKKTTTRQTEITNTSHLLPCFAAWTERTMERMMRSSIKK